MGANPSAIARLAAPTSMEADHDRDEQPQTGWCSTRAANECGEASARCRSPPDIVDQNVDAAEAIPHKADDLLRTLGRAEVGFHEQIRLKQVMGGGSRRGDHRCSRTSEALNYGFAYAFGAAGHERALAGEF